MRTHLAVKQPMSLDFVSACGRGQRTNENVYRVDCALCWKTDAYILAKDEADSAKHAAFMAQAPRVFAEPWRDGQIWCRNCGFREFRMGDRTCYGHYENYHCANCGHVESRLTETGMSF